MSRSRKKTPVGSWANVRTGEEARAKRKARKALRRINKIRLQSDQELLLTKEKSNPWSWPKDGKTYFDPKKFPKDMRK